MEKQNWQKEQQRVDRVIGIIDQRLDKLEQHVSETKLDIVQIRKNFWDDVTVNLEDVYELAETHASIKQQVEVLSERERSHRHARNQLLALKRLRQSPYFGRIDFVEAGRHETERIYLGTASLMDETEENFLVYDWRAPVSSLYYDYPPGPAQYETPGGTIKGTIDLKRQYVIRDGRIRSLFDTGITVGDELLQQVLGKQADSQMKSIVATIQKEQNQIIRNEKSHLLVVQGAAGSGKTSAALQRVAYLLYRYRGMLRAENIVLFSPNPMFNSYVSTVLPELGEENMQQATFQEYLERRLGKNFRLEDPFTQMEYTLTAMDQPGYIDRIEGIRYKATADFMHVIEQYAAALGRGGMVFKDVKFRGQILFSAADIAGQFYRMEQSLPIPNRMKLLSEWLLKELKEQARRERKKKWVEDEIELLDTETYARAYQKLRRKKQYTEDTFNDFDREKELLASVVVQERLKPIRARIKRLGFVDIPAIYRRLFAEPAYIARFDGAPASGNWPGICSQTLDRLERSELAYEDAVPYLYLKERIEGFETNTSIRHVFIDEAQDYSPFQFAFIKRLFPRAKMTVLGDLNQAIFAHVGSGEAFSALASLYEAEQAETIVLKRSYRSTRQIIEFTSSMIEGGEEIEPFNREGSKPVVKQAADKPHLAQFISGKIRELQAAGHETVAVICKTAQESEEAYDALRNEVPLRLIKKETASFESGVLVIPSYLAKGVEFDAVIIYNGSLEQYGRENERRLFYTACTRAMHELHIFFLGEMSPFIAGVSADTYHLQS
ncbi:RNA polymerase recycling motor HelD [Aneurinibacillus sp. Ricciae_BoGa-3]|uniref:RNA polymerase recycling motor HelD n=1 Tax=Aneurinibacillus sp. Ricciae_BoGa-3 TaxID=3022697 RepID=UPI00233FBB90|nr:RNA polymerase recycling motor HelD [Aneurinibacillus sp. Ricciae_BoGa-3]WCK54482.1 RNA polymerase recycling motor HelD [Aneurinibacillus sp. Ricciae_BoGa-3]